MERTNSFGLVVETPVLAEDASYINASIDRQIADVGRSPPWHPGQQFDLEPTEEFLERQELVLKLTAEGFEPWVVAWILQERWCLMDEDAVQVILDNQ